MGWKPIEGSNPSLSASQSWSFGTPPKICDEPRKRGGVPGCSSSENLIQRQFLKESVDYLLCSFRRLRLQANWAFDPTYTYVFFDCPGSEITQGCRLNLINWFSSLRLKSQNSILKKKVEFDSITNWTVQRHCHGWGPSKKTSICGRYLIEFIW